MSILLFENLSIFFYEFICKKIIPEKRAGIKARICKAAACSVDRPCCWHRLRPLKVLHTDCNILQQQPQEKNALQ